MNLTYFRPKMRGMSKTKRTTKSTSDFSPKTSDILNLSENITSDVILSAEHRKVTFNGQGTPARTVK